MKRKELEKMGISTENIQKIMDMHKEATEAKKKEIDTLNERLKEANKQVNDDNEKLKTMAEKDDTIKDLQGKIDGYVKAEKDREAAAEKAKKQSELEEKIKKLAGDKEFSNDYALKGVMADVSAAMEADTTLGIDKAFEAATKDKEGIFKNPQQQRVKIPGVKGVQVQTNAKDYMDSKYADNPFYKK